MLRDCYMCLSWDPHHGHASFLKAHGNIIDTMALILHLTHEEPPMSNTP